MTTPDIPNRRILIVDDNLAIHADFQKILCPGEGLNHKIDQTEAALFGDPVESEVASAFELDFASQGQEALEKVKRAQADGRPYVMAFIDVRMPPGWDGIETTSRIWEVDPCLQVVICTAYSDYSWKQVTNTLRQADRFVILKKPFDVVEVQQMANAFTEKWLLLRQVEERTHKLETSEKRYHFLADSMPAIVWAARPDGKVDYSNKRLEEFYERGAAVSNGFSWNEIVHPEDLAECLKRWANSCQTGEEYQMECRLKRAGDKIYRWHLARGVALRNNTGQILQWVGTCTDIEDQKRAEDVLRRTQVDLENYVIERTHELAAIRARLEHLLRSSPAIIYCARPVPPEQITFISDNVSGVLGYQPAEFTDDPRFGTDRIHPEDKAGVMDHRSRLMESGSRSLEYRFQHQDGSWRWLHDEMRVIRDTQGNAIETVGSWVDITERKKAEKERQLMEVQLRQAQKLETIGQLAAGIAHEINTPTQYVGDNTRFLKDSFDSMTRVLQAYDELLRAAKNNAMSPELVTRVETVLVDSDLAYLFEQIPAAIRETLEGVERVSKIVRAMKEFSHPGGKEKTAADLNKAIETTVTVARNEWKYVADVVFELDQSLPPVPCFIGEFNQVILNLVVNAAHAIGDVVKINPGSKGRITVSTRIDGEQVEVRISDTGTGIPEAVRPKIFEPFFTTKDVGKGTGQGLSIVYGSIVKKHGGTVRFETEVGKGTTFILRLPLKLINPSTPTTGPVSLPADRAPSLKA